MFHVKRTGCNDDGGPKVQGMNRTRLVTGPSLPGVTSFPGSKGRRNVKRHVSGCMMFAHPRMSASQMFHVKRTPPCGWRGCAHRRFMTEDLGPRLVEQLATRMPQRHPHRRAAVCLVGMRARRHNMRARRPSVGAMRAGPTLACGCLVAALLLTQLGSTPPRSVSGLPFARSPVRPLARSPVRPFAPAARPLVSPSHRHSSLPCST